MLEGRLLADRYQLEGELGRGAAGVVHRAHDRVLDRMVALKILNQRSDALDRDRLLHEARAAALLSHPNIVALYDAGEDDGTPYLVMEMVDGPSLRQVGPLDWEGIVRLAGEILDALDHAHGRGLIHRDLKPENILMEPSGPRHRARLADFGVARINAHRTATLDGGIVGTPWYLAPEQALGESIDGRADLYSLGAVLYELVSGRPPFNGNDVLVVIAEHLHAPVVPPRTWRGEVPPMLEGFILRLLAKRPEDRFSGAVEARAALADVLLTAQSGDSDSPSPMLISQLARGRLVGRRAELDRLKGLWTETLGGRGQMVVVSGEPGVGKSRLAQEMLVHARLSGARILRGGSYEFEATTPYLPFIEALRSWMNETTDEALAEATLDIAPDLARLAPELTTRLGPFPERAALTPAEERLRLYEAVARLFKRLASRGLVVFLDDLHWADQGTLSLIHSLLRQIAGSPIFLLGAYREIELDRSHPLAAALVEWNRERLVTRLALGRLSLVETRLFLATLFGQETVGEPFANAIHKETEGNPFFLEEVIKALIEQGQIYRSGNQWMSDTAENLAIPQSVKEAIGRRLDRLGATCLEVIHLAAALGKIFTFAELAAASGRTEDELLDAIDEASRAQLLRPDSGESFAFTHDKIREVLYAEANPVRRRRLHQKILAALETVYAGHLETRVTDLAHHAILAADLDRGFDYSMMAVDRAERVYAHDEARRYADQARECAESLGDKARIVRASRARSEVEVISGSSAAAAEALVSALPSVEDPRERTDIEIDIGQHYASIGDARGLPHLEAVMARLDREAEPDQAARTLGTLARYHHYHLEHRKAVDLLLEARGYAEIDPRPGTMTTIMTFLSGAYQHLGDLPMSRKYAEEAVAFGELHQHPVAAALGHEFLGEADFMVGRWREAVAEAAIDRRIGMEIGARDRMAWADFIENDSCLYGGRLPEAVAAGERCLALAETLGDLRLAAITGGFQTLALAEMGDERWRSMASRTREWVAATGQWFMRHCAASNLASACLVTGDVPGANHIIMDATLPDPGDNFIVTIMRLPILAEIAIRERRPEEARPVLDEMIHLSRTAGTEGFLANGLRLMAWCLAEQGEANAALPLIEEAIEIQERLDHRLALARSLRVRADVTDSLAMHFDSTGLNQEPSGERAARTDRQRADALVKASLLPDNS